MNNDRPDVFRPNPCIKFVNVYLVRRHYGGPQEGGWWFDTGELLHCEPVLDEGVEARVKELEGNYSNEDRRELSSVLSDGVFDVVVSDTPGSDWPDEIPQYE